MSLVLRPRMIFPGTIVLRKYDVENHGQLVSKRFSTIRSKLDLIFKLMYLNEHCIFLLNLILTIKLNLNIMYL